MLAAAAADAEASAPFRVGDLANASPRRRICRPTTVGCRRWQLSLPLKCVAASPNDGLISSSAVAHEAEAASIASPTSGRPPGGDESLPRLRLHQLADEFHALPEPIDRVKRLLEYAAGLPPLPDTDRTPVNRVMGCTAQVWIAAARDSAGRMRFAAESDSEITRGFCACLVSALDGAAPEEVMEMRTEDLAELNIVGGPTVKSRVNTWHSVLVSMQKRTKALVAPGTGRSLESPPFLQGGLYPAKGDASPFSPIA